MKILHLLSTARWTGAAEPVFLLCRQLMAMGHEVHLAHSAPFRGWRFSSKKGIGFWDKQQSAMGGRPTLAQKAQEMGLETLPELRLNTYSVLSDNLHDLRVLRRILGSGVYDLCHCHLTHAHLLAALAKGRGSCPLVYTHHQPRPPRRGFFHRWFIQRSTDHVFTYSPEVTQAYRQSLGLHGGRLTTLRVGLDLGKFTPEISGRSFREEWNLHADAFVIGMVARMQKKRDHETLLRAICLLPEDIRCVLIGDGEYRPELERMASEWNLNNRVVFAGHQREKYLEALAALDVFVYTAPGSDSSCRAVIEAMAMGKPVVGARTAALPLLIDEGRTGFLFEPGNSEQLAAILKSLYDQRSLVSDTGKAASTKAFEELSIENLACQVEEVYKQLAG